MESGKEIALPFAEVDYLFVNEDELFYTDGKAKMHSAGLDGSNDVILIDKAIYYPYYLGFNYWMYQDDADHETLHIYNTETKTNQQITDQPAYNPVICGGSIYTSVRFDEASKNYSLEKIDLYAGKREISEEKFARPAFGICHTCGTTNLFLSDGQFVEGLEQWNAIYTHQKNVMTETYVYADNTYHVFGGRNDDGNYTYFALYPNENEQVGFNINTRN